MTVNFKCLGSSSQGNCYILENEKEALVIEAGISFKEVKKALDFSISKIRAVLVSHSHGDHAKYIGEYVKAGIPIVAPWRLHGEESWIDSQFKVKCFKLVHSVPCYGFYIHHPDIGNLVFVTDTEYCQVRFRKVNHIMVEANYSNEILGLNAYNREHVISGHMELQTTLEFIRANKTKNLRSVILLHLSDSNSNQSEFERLSSEIAGMKVVAADKGLIIELGGETDES